MPIYIFVEMQLLVIEPGKKVFVFDTPVVLFCYSNKTWETNKLLQMINGYKKNDEAAGMKLFFD
jgi:hypothetical protein